MNLVLKKVDWDLNLFFFSGKIFVIVQIKFVIGQLTEVNILPICRHQLQTDYRVAMSGLTDIKLIKVVFICVAWEGVGGAQCIFRLFL